MPRRRRRDEPGDWFHVMNRALARRSMFEQRADIGFFLARLGETVARGWLEVHSFTVLTTHFHALVRSPCRELSCALRHVQLAYVRHFNRTRRRDGPLLRGRFRALRVDSEAYRRVLVGYIDDNPRAAGLCRDPADYPFGSCRSYVTGSGPDWLCRDWIHAEVRAWTGVDHFDGRHYREVFERDFTAPHRELVERRSLRAGGRDDPADSLLDGAAPAVLGWLRRKAALADGTAPGLALAPAARVDAAVAAVELACPARAPGRQCRTDWRRAGLALLLREVAGLTLAAIGGRLGCSVVTARELCRRARGAVLADPDFAATVAAAAYAALAATYESAPRGEDGRNVPGSVPTIFRP